MPSKQPNTSLPYSVSGHKQWNWEQDKSIPYRGTKAGGWTQSDHGACGAHAPYMGLNVKNIGGYCVLHLSEEDSLSL